jgi:hypothetical protein
VHQQVPSAAARLDQFLCASGVGPDKRVTVIGDDAGEFGKAVEGGQIAKGRILDWFHIAMKFKAAENSVFGSATIEPLEREAVKTRSIAPSGCFGTARAENRWFESKRWMRHVGKTRLCVLDVMVESAPPAPAREDSFFPGAGQTQDHQ